MLLILILPLVGCDRITKEQAQLYLRGKEPIAYFGDLFTLSYHENIGAMLSFGATFPEEFRFFVFTVVVGISLLTALIYCIVSPLKQHYLIIAGLLLAGGFGNLYDRVFYDGKVIDFMKINCGPLYTGVFNIADIAIMLGFFGFLVIGTKRGKTSMD